MPLEGVGVLVTRPETDAPALCRVLEEQGASTARLALIEIRPLAGLDAAFAHAGAPQGFHLIVFTSANAVRHGAAYLGGHRDLPLAAVGPATARALAHEGHAGILQPAARFDSEGLLALPPLASPAGRRVLIVKGRGGRELLEPTLRGRGAEVVTLDVYERVALRPPAAALTALVETFERRAIQVVTATSLEIASRLSNMADPALRRALERTHWLVPGARLAAGVRKLGVGAPLIEARSAEDQALVSALVEWRASGGLESGA